MLPAEGRPFAPPPPLSPREVAELLDAAPPRVINLAVLLAICTVLFAAALGHVLGRLCPCKGLSCPASVFAAITASYLVLVPGVFMQGFSFNLLITVPLLGKRVGLTRDEHTGAPAPVAESYASLVGLLLETGCTAGAALVVLYAFALPAIKLLLLCLGECWRHHQDVHRKKMARRCIIFVQVISKWAAPDMFAYVLLYYLFRDLNRPPLLEALAILDVGFTCYAVFCVSSVISTLCVSLPDVPGGAMVDTERPPWVIRLFGRDRVVLVAGVLAWLGLSALAIGLPAPCFAIRANSNVLIQPQGPLPANVSLSLPLGVTVSVPLKPVLDRVDLGRFINADVSLWRCAEALARWFAHSGETNLALALAIVAGLAVLLTALDLMVLVLAAHRLRAPPRGGGLYFRSQGPAMRAAYVLKHVAMLDVCLMGVLVVCLAGSIYKKQGVELSMSWGMVPLAAAEAIHYLSYYSVAAAAEFIAATEPPLDAKK